MREVKHTGFWLKLRGINLPNVFLMWKNRWTERTTGISLVEVSKINLLHSIVVWKLSKLANLLTVEVACIQRQ